MQHNPLVIYDLKHAHTAVGRFPAQRALTLQSYVEVDSPAPPCPGCFGVAPRLLTPSGQKLMLLAKLAYSRRQFSPCGAAHPRCLLAARSSAAHYLQIVHRKSYIVHQQLPRSCLGPSCVLSIVHGRRQPPRPLQRTLPRSSPLLLRSSHKPKKNRKPFIINHN